MMPSSLSKVFSMETFARPTTVRWRRDLSLRCSMRRSLAALHRSSASDVFSLALTLPDCSDGDGRSESVSSVHASVHRGTLSTSVKTESADVHWLSWRSGLLGSRLLGVGRKIPDVNHGTQNSLSLCSSWFRVIWLILFPCSSHRTWLLKRGYTKEWQRSSK